MTCYIQRSFTIFKDRIFYERYDRITYIFNWKRKRKKKKEELQIIYKSVQAICVRALATA